MSLLDILAHYPNSPDQRVAWYQKLTAALNSQNAHQLQFDNIQPCGSAEEQLAALQCCTVAVQCAQGSAHQFEIATRTLHQASRYCRSEAVPHRSAQIQTALLELCAASTTLGLACVQDSPQHERALTQHVLETLMPLMELQWLSATQAAHHPALIALCRCAVQLSNRNVGTSAVMNVTWKLIKWCLKETGRCFVTHAASDVVAALLHALTQLLLSGYRRYTTLRAVPDADTKLLLAVDKSLKFLFPCLVVLASNYPDLLALHLEPIAELTTLVVPGATTDSTRQYCYKGLLTIFRHVVRSPHLTATQFEHVITQLTALGPQLILDLVPELGARVTVQSTDWPVQVLVCVIAHVMHADPHGADTGEISASPSPSPTPTPPVIQQSLQFLTHVLASASPSMCHVVRELVVSHVLDVNWHVSQLALQWWCLLLDTHRDHDEIYLHVLHALIERHQQWTRGDRCQTDTLVTALLETRVSALLLHSLMHVSAAQQQRVVQWLTPTLRAQLSMTPLGLTLAALTGPHAHHAQLVRTVQQALAEFTPAAPACLLEPLAQLVNGMAANDSPELTALLTRLLDWYSTLPPSDTCQYSVTLARLLTYMAIRLRTFTSPQLPQVLARMTQLATAGHRGVLYFGAFVALCLQQTTVPVPQCAALIAALLDARHTWPVRLATLIALADVAALMPAPELLEELVASEQLTALLTLLDHATPSCADVSARVTAVAALLEELRLALASRVVTGATSASDPDSALIQTTVAHLDSVLFDLRKLSQHWPHETHLVASLRSAESVLHALQCDLKQCV